MEHPSNEMGFVIFLESSDEEDIELCKGGVDHL